MHAIVVARESLKRPTKPDVFTVHFRLSRDWQFFLSLFQSALFEYRQIEAMKRHSQRR
jgi:hypothetical protein